jgi:hypothetical protein
MGLKTLMDEGPRAPEAGSCKTCRWLDGLDTESRATAETIIAASNDKGEWLYSHKQLARDLRDDGLKASDTAIANHRESHVAR